MLSEQARAGLRSRYPEHFFTRVVDPDRGVSAIIAIPKVHADKSVRSMPGVTVDLLHGATITLLNTGASNGQGK